MADEIENKQETTEKRPFKPFTGLEGNTFAKDNQPSSEAKKAGWQARRAERLLTQEILRQLVYEDEGKPLKEYISALHKLAMKGHPKAIETINKGIEDDIIKVDVSTPTAIRIIRDKDV